jgi:Spy/CpxP family protein refolding chaperone
MRPGPGGMGQYGPLCNWQDDTTPPLMLGMLDLTEEQKETITNLVEQSRAKLHADIEAVLTDEQLEKIRQLRDENENRPFAGLDLTAEQKTAIAEIREKARADAAAAETRQKRHEIMQAAHDEILSVLTEEQIGKLERFQAGGPWEPGRPGRGYPGVGPKGPIAGPDGIPPVLEVLDLTEEQKAAIAEIRENAIADAEAAETREARRDIMQAAHDEILSVLTDEQIEELGQLCPRTPLERRGPGRGRW